jgi:hypothetical protein
MSARLPAGPPPKTARVHSMIFRMNPYERATLRAVAKHHGISMSAVLRKLLLAEDDRLDGVEPGDDELAAGGNPIRPGPQ